MKYKINLNNQNKLKNFMNKIIHYDFDIDIVKGRYIIDAKSIMGIFTLDLVDDLDLEIHTDDEELISKFSEDIKEFLA